MMVITLFSSWLCYNTVLSPMHIKIQLRARFFSQLQPQTPVCIGNTKNLKFIRNICPEIEMKNKTRISFVFAKFFQKMQLVFTLTSNCFDPNLTSARNLNNGLENASVLMKAR